MKKFILSTVSLLLAFSAWSQDIKGSWNGLLDVSIIKLRLVFHIEEKDGVYSATMDSPDQGAKGLPVTSVTFKNPHLQINIADVGANYEGVLQNDTIRGNFMQMGQVFPLVFTRNEIAAKLRPQDPIPPYPYNTEDVKFENAEAGITLAGTLSWPKEGSNFPVAVLVTGSGPQNRNEEVFDHRPFLVLSDHLTRNGIAVLRYDDRGVAESGGNYATATIDDFSDDAAAAVAYVKTRKEINPEKIGIIGHSMGGTIAFMLAGKDNSDLAYIVSMAGMAIPGDSLLRMQRYLTAKASDISDVDVAQNELLISRLDSIVNKHSEEYILQNMDDIADFLLPDSLKDNKTFRAEFQYGIQVMISPEFKSIRNCNPAGVLTKIQCPVLAVNGEKDLQVPADANLDRVKALVKSPVTIKKYLGLNHLFQHAATGLITEYAQIEETIAPEVLRDITEWLQKTVMSYE